MHESLNEFKFQPDTTTNTRVICPCTSEKLMNNVVNTLAPLFLIGSSSFLQVRRTTKVLDQFDQIPWTVEFAALERLENPNRLIMGKSCEQSSTFIFNLIFFILAGNKNMHEAWMSLNFGKFAIELRPLINSRIEFLLNILKTNRPIKTKFCIHIIIDKIYVGIVNHCFLANLQQSYCP